MLTQAARGATRSPPSSRPSAGLTQHSPRFTTRLNAGRGRSRVIHALSRTSGSVRSCLWPETAQDGGRRAPASGRTPLSRRSARSRCASTGRFRHDQGVAAQAGASPLVSHRDRRDRAIAAGTGRTLGRRGYGGCPVLDHERRRGHRQSPVPGRVGTGHRESATPHSERQTRVGQPEADEARPGPGMAKVRNRRRDFHHKITRALINQCDAIALEDLNAAGMTRRPAPKPDPGTQERSFQPGSREGWAEQVDPRRGLEAVHRHSYR